MPFGLAALLASSSMCQGRHRMLFIFMFCLRVLNTLSATVVQGSETRCRGAVWTALSSSHSPAHVGIPAGIMTHLTTCRGLLCEPPEVRSIEYYLTNDVPLAAFLVAAGPAPGRRCVQTACGDGASAHLQTFLHGRGRITLSVSRLPDGQELPGDDKGQIWVWARPLKVCPRSMDQIEGPCIDHPA